MSSEPIALVYVSRLSESLLKLKASELQEQLQALQAQVFRSGLRDRIRGFLLQVDGFFVHWIEGAEAEVRGLFERIEQDSRHTEVRCIHLGPATQLLTAWSMSQMSRPDMQTSAAPRINSLLKEGSDPTLCAGAADILRSILKPSATNRVDKLPRRVGLFGPSSLWTANLLTHLSKKWEQPLLRSRLLMGEALDQASVLEYLDVEHPTLGGLHLVNYSGDIVKVDVTQALVGSLDLAVLFMSDNHLESQQSFLSDCLDLLGPANKVVPLMTVFGRNSAQHMPTIAERVRALGREPIQVESHLADNQLLWHCIDAQLQRSPRLLVAATNAQHPASDAALPGGLTKTSNKVAASPEAAHTVPIPTPTVGAEDTGTLSERSGAIQVLDMAAVLPAVRTWVSSLTGIDGIAAVGVFLYEAATALDGTGPRLLAYGLASHLVGTTDDEQQLWPLRLTLLAEWPTPAAAGVVSARPQECMVYTAERLCLSMVVPDRPELVLVLVTDRGRRNEMLLRAEIKISLASRPGALQAV